MELVRAWIALIRPRTENQMANYKQMYGYQLAPTKYPSVFQRREGGYVVRGRAKDLSGKQKVIFKVLEKETLLQAVQYLESEKQKIRDGIVAREVTTLFSEFCASVFDAKVKRGDIVSADGISKWKHILTHLINGTKVGDIHVLGFGKLLLADLRPAHVEHWKDGLAQFLETKEYAPTTFNTWLRVLRVISKAAAKELDGKDFMFGVEDFSTREHVTYSEEKPNSLKPEDAATFLSEMRRLYPQHYAMVFLGFATGLRPSSLRPLRRNGPEADVLWDESRLRVRRSQTRGERVMQSTKTGKRYSVHLPEGVMDVLRWHVETQLSTDEMKASELLFPATNGKFRAPSVLNKPFKEVADRIGLAYPLSQRGMRRTFQDLARAAEVEDVVTRSISGHSTAQMQTLYSSVSANEQREGLSRVFRVIQGGASSNEVDRGVDSEGQEVDRKKDLALTKSL